MSARRLLTLCALLLISGLDTSNGMPEWYDCNEANCKAPDCMCASNSAPGGLAPKDTPQFILITHDDAVNPFSNKVVRSVIDKHTNPNGCNVPATWYTLQQGSDCATVKKLRDENSEFALHTVNHFRLVPNYPGGEKALDQEMFGVRKWLNEECGIPLEDLVGYRNPYLLHNPQTRSQIQKEGMLYDSSMISVFSPDSEVQTVPGERVWPFTMDYGIPIDCNWNYPDGQCNRTSERYPGIWEVPLWELQNAAGDHLFSMDPEGDVFSIFKENFDMNYLNNRAPFGIFLHAPWFTDKNTEALNQFMDYAMAQPDVWAITTRQLIEWMKDPVPASKMGEWLKCNPVDLTAPMGDVRCQQYTVQPSDTSYLVATKFAVLTDEFLDVNPEIGDGSVLTVGEKVRIPPWGDDCIGDAIKPVTGPGQVTQAPSDTEGTTEKFECTLHNIIPGDTWESIANSYQVKLEDLRGANTDVRGDILSPGVTLRIPPYQDNCPDVVNEARPVILGPSAGVDDPDPPSTGLRINLKLQGRTKTELQTDLLEPFKATVARAIDMTAADIRVVNITSLNSAAGLRRMLLQAEPQVEVELTVTNPSPLGAFANYTRDLSMESDFNTKELKAFKIQEISPPVIRVIEDGVTMDVDTNSIPDPAENGASGGSERLTTPQAATESTSDTASSDGGSGLSTGAIVGIAVGGVAAVAIIAAVVVMVTRRRKREPTTPESESDSIPSDNSGSPKMDSTKDDEL
ncbi:hypothetical protein M9435_000535 [Picochlorum sp. BPE23]|nr:hypothetical protein M9435_000535 [Picochlorum sp. BPE23]